MKQEDVGWGRILTWQTFPQVASMSLPVLVKSKTACQQSLSCDSAESVTHKMQQKNFQLCASRRQDQFQDTERGEGRGEQRKKYQRTGGSYPTGSRPPSPPPSQGYANIVTVGYFWQMVSAAIYIAVYCKETFLSTPSPCLMVAKFLFC